MAIFSPQTKALLSASGIATAFGAVATLLGSKEFAENPQAAILLNALILSGNIGSNILATEIQTLFSKVFKYFKQDEKQSFATIQKLVRQAIFNLINENLSEALTDDDAEIIKSIAENDKIDLKFEEILDEHYEELSRKQKIYRFFSHKPETSLNLTTETSENGWKEILKWLAVEDTRCGAKHSADISDETLEILAEKLRKNFPQALRDEVINQTSNESNALNDIILTFIGENSELTREISDVLTTFKQNTEEKLKDISDKQTEQGKILGNLNASLNQVTTLLEFPPTANNVADFKQIEYQFYDLNRYISDGFRKFNEDFNQLFDYTKQNLAITLDTNREVKEIRNELRKEWKFIDEKNGKTKVLIRQVLPFSIPVLNNYFTGREKVLEMMTSQLEDIGKASLYGLHGLGKTQTVLKFAKENKHRYAHIIFINAAKDIFLNSMAQFADIFDLNWQNYGFQDREISDDEKKCYAVKDFLENDKIWSNEKRRFLLIFDNVDEPENIKPFVPTQDQGDILFTSNSKYIRDRATLVEILEMDKDDAKLLLYRRGKGKMSADFEDIPKKQHKFLEEIAENLAYLPVLLENAAVTISDVSLSFENYLERLKSKPTIALEKEHIEIDYQFKNAKNGFSISFELMTEEDSEEKDGALIVETVKEVLYACSVLSPLDIPEDLLQKYIEKLDNRLSEAVNDEEFWEKVRKRLTRFDLLEYDADKQLFDMHRFVQYVIWNYLIY